MRPVLKTTKLRYFESGISETLLTHESNRWRKHHNAPSPIHCTCHLGCIKNIHRKNDLLKPRSPHFFVYGNEILNKRVPWGHSSPCSDPQASRWEPELYNALAVRRWLKGPHSHAAECVILCNCPCPGRKQPQLSNLTGGNLLSSGMIIKLFVLLKESNYRHVKKGKHSLRNSSSHASQEAPGPLKIPWWRGKTAWEQPGGNTAN